MAQDFTQCLPYMMRTVTQVLYQQLERTLRPHGLTQAQLGVLAQLGLAPSRGMSGAELAQGAGMTAQSMSTAIASLLERGLVDRTPHPTHGRVLEVRITASGSELLELAQTATIPVEQRAVAQLSAQEQAELKRLIHKVMETLGLRTSLPRDPSDVAAYDELEKYTIGGPRPLTAPIRICDYDPVWPELYRAEEARIRHVLGDRVVRIEHAGSTSVPGLPAKAIIDIVLEVPDSADEATYVADLEAADYVLRIRETDWFEHRLFKGPDTDVNLHTFSANCPEVDRMLSFRDWLRCDAADRDLYASAKRELAARDWRYMQQYADAKSAVVGEIMARAMDRSARTQ